LTRLSAMVCRRLDTLVRKNLAVIVGDANGADRAVQAYLKQLGHSRVEVFCTNGLCRNNLGNWPIRAVAAQRGADGFRYYAAKDEEMTKECSIGFMIWEGKSRGTFANIQRLVDAGKKVVVYFVPRKEFVTIRNRNEWNDFLAARGLRVQKASKRPVKSSAVPSVHSSQVTLF